VSVSMKCVSRTIAIDIYIYILCTSNIWYACRCLYGLYLCIFSPYYTECLICSFMADGWYFSSLVKLVITKIKLYKRNMLSLLEHLGSPLVLVGSVFFIVLFACVLLCFCFFVLCLVCTMLTMYLDCPFMIATFF